MFILCATKLKFYFYFFFSSRRRHTRFKCDWSSDVCSSDLRLPRDRADTRVRVLHVVDGVVARLARGHREVEFERAVVAPGEEGEARGVAADLLQQLVHQHELAAPLGHP